MTTYNPQAINIGAQVSSAPGFGAVPPVGTLLPNNNMSGRILTTNGMNGSSWMSQGITTPNNAIQIGSPDPVITFHIDGNITTKSGTISSEEWITVIKVMKQLIMDMSKDQELASKYPYIQDAAHSWFMNELKGKDNGNT